MKVGLYNGAGAWGLGGCEYAIAVLADHWRTAHDVEIVVENPNFSLDALAAFSGVPLDGVRRRVYQCPPFVRPDSTLPWRQRATAAGWNEAASAGYDLFVCFTHDVPPFCHARCGVLWLMFPWRHRRDTWAWWGTDAQGLAGRLRRLFSEWEWRARMASYRHAFSVSAFTQTWAAALWGLNTKTVYPPVATDFAEVEKEPLIVSVGRFDGPRPKNQLELVRTFHGLETGEPRVWRYSSVGGLSERDEDRRYFDAVCEVAGNGVSVEANVSRARLVHLLERASLLWHGGGLGEDEARHPHLSEHFGIAVVEAMAAGAVPLVISRGGLTETVEHGVSGYHWRTLEELRVLTNELTANPSRLQALSKAARQRAQAFSRRRFLDQFDKVIQDL